MMIQTLLNTLKRWLVMGTDLRGRLKGTELSWRTVLFLVTLIAAIWLPVLCVRLDLISNLLFIGSYEANLLGVLSIVSIAGTWAVAGGRCVILWTNYRLQRERLAERALQGAAHRDFMRRLDHEMKNPLTTIRVGLLNVQQHLPADQETSLTRISLQLDRLQRLVEGLRYLTQIEEYTVERVPVDLRDVLENAIALVCESPGHQERSIELHIQQIPWPLDDVCGDPELLLMAFRNALDNASKYTPPQGKVIVRSSEDGRMILTEIIDTGIGIPAEDLAHVFDELYRGQNAHGVPGNGLGLALVQRIVRLHSGKLEIASRLDQGTVLKIWLPIVSKAQS
jgi:two-component system, OmpR family, sensor kinase